MIVYCEVEECRHNKDGRCGCVWPVGIEAISIEQTPFGVECIPVAIKNGMLHKITDPVSCEEVAMALSKSVVDALASLFVTGPKEAKPEGAEDGPNQ